MATEDMLKLMIGAYLASLFVAAFLRSRSWRAVGRIVAALILWAGLSYCFKLGSLRLRKGAVSRQHRSGDLRGALCLQR